MHTAVNSSRTAGLHCPGCLTPARPAAPRCPSCGIWLAGPQAAELRWISAELGRVDVARTWLISRRAALLDELTGLARQPGRTPAAAAASPATSLPPARPEVAAGPAANRETVIAPAPAHRPEVSGRTAATLLLAAGAGLVAIAVAIFTVAGWSRIGPLGRCGILLAATAVVLAAPRPIVRRGLHGTAESVAAIGLVLTLGDAFLIHRFLGLPAGPLPVAAFCAAMAAAWVAYGTGARLSGPRLAAIGIAQLILPFTLAGIAGLLGGTRAPLAAPAAAGLVLTAAADALLGGTGGTGGPLHRIRQHRGPAEPRRRRGSGSPGAAVATASATAAIATWTCGVMVAAAGLAAYSARPAGRAVPWGSVAWLALTFAAAAIVGITGPGRCSQLAGLARPAAVISGALAAMSLAIAATALLPAGWALAATGACGFCVCAAALAVGPLHGSPATTRAGLPSVRRLDLALGSAAILAVTTVIAAPAAVAGLIPAHPILPAWAGPGPASAPGPLGQPHPVGATALLALCALACLLARLRLAAAPARIRAVAVVVGVVTAAFAAGSLPVAAGLTGWAALTVLTSAAAVLLTASAVLGERTTAIVAVACGSGLALTAALWSLATPPSAIAELAALTASFGLSAARARHTGPVVVTTAGALAAATGLAWAAPLAVGWPPGDAAFAVLGVAVAAAAAATVLRRARPRQSVVLDLGAGLVALLSAAITGGQQDGFAFVAVTSAVIASSTAWLRTGHRRMTAAAAAAIAALAAVVAVRRPLGQALLAPAHVLANPWQGSAIATSRPPGLPLAIGVLALCLAALATAVGAWRGSGRASLDAVAVALPLVAAPAGLAMLNSGPGFLAMVGALLVMTLALTAWAALGESLAPAGAALVSATLTIGWALAAPLPTIVVFGCLTVGYGLCARRSRHAVVRIAAGSLTVLSAAALAEAAAFAAGLAAWEAALGALAIAAGAQIAAARFASDRDHGPSGEERTAERAASTRPALGLAIEVSGWMVAAAAVGQCLGRPWTAGVATAIAGITCLGVSARPGRRAALWAGLALCYAAWCTGLAAGGVSVPEAYTGPAALIALAAGWRASGREPRPHSWLAYGPGLALFLLPSLFAAWGSTSWIRPALAGLAAIAIAIAGARTRTQAPLLTGTVVALLDAGRELAPDVMRVVHALPGWIPVAVGGMVLLWAGATYEARLRNLTAIRRSLAAMS